MDFTNCSWGTTILEWGAPVEDEIYNKIKEGRELEEDGGGLIGNDINHDCMYISDLVLFAMMVLVFE